MRAYSNMATSEFVQQIRDIAINAKAHPLVIDQIDALADGPTEKDIEKQIEEAADEGDSNGRRVMWEFCFDAVDKVLEDMDLGEDAREAILTVLTKLEPQQ